MYCNDVMKISMIEGFNGNKNRKINKMRAVLVSALLFLVVLAIPVFAEEFATIKPIGDLNAEAPELTAKSAALYSMDLHKVVYGKNEDERVSPYSVTKLLTCYMALEKLNPDDVVTVSAKAAQVYENGTTIYLQEGEKISVRDLVYGALLASGNDAAYALGEAVAGSEKSFADQMNALVQDWGCADTHFVNANGWKNDDHYTTAHDMSIIAEHCFSNEELQKMSIEKTYTIPATNVSGARELENYTVFTTRKLKDITGGKTGTWTDEDASLVVSFERDSIKAVAVLLADEKDARAKDAGKLMAFAAKVTPGFLVSSEGDEVTEARVKHGEFTKTKLAVDGTTTAYPASEKAEDIQIEMNVEPIEAPLKKGEKVGTYRVVANDNVVAEHNLVATEDIEVGWFPSYIYISNQQTIIGSVLGGILLIVLIILAVRAAKRRKETQYVAKH